MFFKIFEGLAVRFDLIIIIVIVGICGVFNIC